MRKQSLSLILAALVLGGFASIALAQEAAPAKPQDEEKTALYTKYYEGIQGTPEQQKVAYAVATEYLKSMALTKTSMLRQCESGRPNTKR